MNKVMTTAVFSTLTAFTLLGSAQGADVKLPMLPGAAVAQTLVNTALSNSSEIVDTAAAKAVSSARISNFGGSAANGVVVYAGRRSNTPTATGRSRVVFATAYNSEVGQTDDSPFITATGTRTRPGVLAVSRDLLRVFPYGTRVRLEDLTGNSPWLNGRTFIVEDTMNARFTNRIDLWMTSHSEAINWGGRSVRITPIR